MQSFIDTYVHEYIPALLIDLPVLGVVDVTKIVVAVGFFLFLLIFFKLLKEVVLVYLRALSNRTSTDVDDVIIDAIHGIRAWVYGIVAVWLTAQWFALPGWLDTALTAVFLAAVVWQAIEVALCFVSYGTRRFIEKDSDGDGVIDPNTATASDMITLMARIVLWCLGGLFVLSNLGIEVTSLIAGLGIGGIAVAFALQGILSDLFASFSLYFDKPFRVGDYIVIGNDAGTVEKIGVKTTRIRTMQGEELVVSNAELTTARVQNFKRMNERRISFSFGILYETPYEKVVAINDLVRAVCDEVAGIRFDRVFFTSFGDSALIFEVVYYVESAEYPDYLKAQQAINHGLLKRFATEGIEFAYPTQTLYVKQ
ncbi:MAG: mechanosensitive ion channel family protein [Candidatus Paceibacterota bacterium]